MKFYDALQLNPSDLKEKIKASGSRKEKIHYQLALIIRAILLVIFSVVFIAGLNMVFGNENGAMSVVIFCVLLSIRFIDLGYQISHSLINLAISFAILLISPLLMQAVPPVIGFIINFVSIMLITFMVCDQPEMGNGGLFLFGYVFLSGNPVTGASFINRALLTFTGYAICGAILFMKHRHKNKGLSFRKIVSRFDIHAPKSQWQIQLALGMSLLFLLGRIFNIDRFMWMGFACASMLSAWPMDMKWRPLDRAAGVIIGSLLFWIIYTITPANMQFLYGPVSGLCLGFCTTYRAKTVFNCFGALLAATSIYGSGGAVELRIFNNLIGILFGFLFFYFFQKIMVDRIFTRQPLSEDPC